MEYYAILVLLKFMCFLAVYQLLGFISVLSKVMLFFESKNVATDLIYNRIDWLQQQTQTAREYKEYW
jgi:hypothetical protein